MKTPKANTLKKGQGEKKLMKLIARGFRFRGYGIDLSTGAVVQWGSSVRSIMVNQNGLIHYRTKTGKQSVIHY